MSATNWLENKIVDYVFRDQAWTPPAAFWIGLSKAEVTDTGTVDEPSGGDYARVQLDPSATNWTNTQASGTGASSGTSGITRNAVAIEFPVATANWGLVTHWFISSASSGGDIVVGGNLTASKNITTNDQFSLPVGDLSITVA